MNKSMLHNEKGIALVVALVMLVLLTLLGAYALSTSSTELFIAGNYRNAELAFYAANAGNEYGELMFFKINTSSPQVWWPGPAATNYQALTVGNGYTTNVNIQYVETQNSWPGAEEGTVADYYVITSIGRGPTNTQERVETMVVWPRIVSAGGSLSL